MINIFEECDEALPESKKLRFLWESIQDAKLSPTIEAIKAAVNRDPKSWNFVDAADHIASQIPAINKQSKHIASLGRNTESAPSTGVMKGGKVWTGSYDREVWNKLSKDEKDQVFNARKALSGKGPKKSENKVKSLKKQLKKTSKLLEVQKRKLSALGKGSPPESDASSVSSSDSAHAGSAFGGKESRTGSKTKKRKKSE